MYENTRSYAYPSSNQENPIQPPEVFPQTDNLHQEGHGNQEQGNASREEYFKVLDELKTKRSADDFDKDTNIQDGNTSCLATCTTSDLEDDFFQSSFICEAQEGEDDERSYLTSCVGTRWYTAPELLYGSTNYGLEIDLWSLGCIFTELSTLGPLFPGTADIDQISRTFYVLCNLNEEAWPDCSKLADY